MKAIKYNGQLWIPADKAHTIELPVIDLDEQAEQITRLKDCVKADLAYLMRKDELNTTHVKANLIIQNEQALAAQPQKGDSDE